MNEAARLASSGAPHGTVVLADEQTSGVGRLGRSWISERDVGLYCSIVLRLRVRAEELPVVTLALGLATVDAIQTSSDTACDLRWPNDVLIHERKVAGILAQLLEGSIIAGIGINVNQTAMPEHLRTPATSLRLETGRVHSRETLLTNLLESAEALCSVLTAEGAQSIIRAFCEASTYAVDRRIIIEDTGQKGITEGIDENGYLLMRADNGRLERIATGGIRPDHLFAQA